ncbi:MAG: hypothetical protein E6R03_16805 [Hyphomicrobiaceae bacterium]|nr:MAG: hypothetical protein E6R03_16805 [Hyphomicrobiaceae bacterium]
MSLATERMIEARWAGYGSNWPDGYRECTKCSELKPTADFHKHAKCRGGYNSVCKSCRQPLSQANYKATAKELRLYNAAKNRAAQKGREFSIELSDIVIPKVCPVLGTPMVSPSLDRIDSRKGYVKGNVRVISKRANTLKNDATVAEMKLVLADLIRLAGVCEIL